MPNPAPRRLTEPREVRLFFWLGWLTYFGTYLGRLNFTASLTEIAAAEGFTKAQMGLVGSGFFLGYGVCQLLSGFLGDRLPPRLMIFVGTFGSGALNLAMGCSASPAVMVLLWTLNGIVQSAVWAPLVRLTMERLRPAQGARCCVNYATTVPAGTFAAYLFSAGMIALFGWRSAFWLSGAALLAVSLVWLVGIGRLERAADGHGELPEDGEREKAAAAPRAAARGARRIILPLVLISVAALLHGFLKDSIQTWMPAYLKDVFELSSVSAIVFTMAVPLVNLAGVYLGNWLDRSAFRNELRTSGTFFGLAALLLAVMALCRGTLAASILLFSGSAAALLAINTMLVTLVPLRLRSRGRISTITGILNSVTYVGSTISNYGGGVLIDDAGWSSSLLVWRLLAGAGCLLCLVIAPLWGKVAGPREE